MNRYLKVESRVLSVGGIHYQVNLQRGFSQVDACGRSGNRPVNELGNKPDRVEGRLGHSLSVIDGYDGICLRMAVAECRLDRTGSFDTAHIGVTGRYHREFDRMAHR